MATLDLTNFVWALVLVGLFCGIAGLLAGLIIAPYTIKPPKGRHCSTGPHPIPSEDRPKAASVRQDHW